MALLSLEANEKVEDYLSEVAAILEEDGHRLPEIRNIVDGLKEQIHEMATQGGQKAASLEDIDEALEAMEPPAAFRAASRVLALRAKNRTVVRALAFLSVGLFIGTLLAFWLLRVMESTASFAGTVYGLGLLIALAAGLASWSHPLGRFGALAAVLLFLAGVFVAR